MGNILVFPVDGSHWVSLKVLVEELHAKGHEIAVVRASDSWYISEKSPSYTSIMLLSSGGFEEIVETYVDRQVEVRLAGRHGIWSCIWNQIQLRQVYVDQLSSFHKGVSEMIIQIFEDKNLMLSLQQAKYDVRGDRRGLCSAAPEGCVEACGTKARQPWQQHVTGGLVTPERPAYTSQN
ncbi:unnamed protein product [Tetraodon nigroviridis]|uniref:(spotted green pufferfish) hypothetical protein n=1 Tax=Tetraodon nigroviridis TaxID=99883 RepID=Q4S1B3_TETNG|nr:unnamed protein product [Tetraodon nigroviridis]